MGVLPAEEIAALITSGGIRRADGTSAASFGEEVRARRRLQPASLDLSLGKRAFRIRASFLPAAGARVADRLADGLLMHEIDLSEGAVLERGCVYLVELSEELKLPPDIRGAANPKSSTGRIDVFVRLVTESEAGARPVFDDIPAGYHGPLFAEICPRIFSIIVREGSSLNQIRFKSGHCAVAPEELSAIHDVTPLLDGPASTQNGLQLSVDLCGTGNGPVGWRARRHTGLIDIDVPGACAARDFFTPIDRPDNGLIILDPDEFYILASKEALAIPPDYAAEMAPMSPGLGEFRVHYAGFFDPGFGWQAQGGLDGSRGVLEVRSHDAPFVLEHGQPVARLNFEHMSARPGAFYGAGVRSNYQGQGLRLSKHFRQE